MTIGLWLIVIWIVSSVSAILFIYFTSKNPARSNYAWFCPTRGTFLFLSLICCLPIMGSVLMVFVGLELAEKSVSANRFNKLSNWLAKPLYKDQP